MPTCLIVSSALKPGSKTLTLALAVRQAIERRGLEADLLDLAVEKLPPCDGAACYGDEAVVRASARVKRAVAVVFCAPIYNYQVNSAAKNFVELTNSGWPDKVVGVVVNAGGDRSFLAVLSLVNSLWIDHHCLVAPRFVYATGAAFGADGSLPADGEVGKRIEALADEICRLAAHTAPAAA